LQAQPVINYPSMTVKKLNNVRFAHAYATSGAGTAGSPWTGWWTALAADTEVHFPVGVYGVNDSGGGAAIPIPSGSKLVCDAGAVITFSAARTTVADMFSIATTANDVSVEGCSFQTAQTVPAAGLSSGGGGAFFSVGASNATTGPLNTLFRKNNFGVFPYSSTPIGVQLAIYSGIDLTIDDNDFERSASGISFADGHTGLVSRLRITNNRFVYTNASSSFGGAVLLGGGSSSTHPTMSQGLISGNLFNNVNCAVLSDVPLHDYDIVNNQMKHTATGWIADWFVMSYVENSASPYLQTNIRVNGNTCDDSSGNTTSACGINIKECDGCEANNNFLRGSNSGTYIAFAAAARNGTIRGNTIIEAPPHYTGGSQNWCIQLYPGTGDMTDITVSDNKLYNCPTAGVLVSSDNGVTLFVKGATIENNTIYQDAGFLAAGLQTDYIVQITSGNTGLAVMNNVAVTTNPQIAAISGAIPASLGMNYTPATGYAAGTLSGTFSGPITGASNGTFLSTGTVLPAPGTSGANTTAYNGTGIVSEGATGNAFEGTISYPDWTVDRAIAFPDAAGTVVLTPSATGITIGPGTDTNFTVLTVDQGTGTDPTITWTDAASVTSPGNTLNLNVDHISWPMQTRDFSRGFVYPTTDPVNSYLYQGYTSNDPLSTGYGDNTYCVAYNADCNGQRKNMSEYSFWTGMEATYDWKTDAGRQSAAEINWDYVSAAGAGWRAFGFFLDTTANDGTGSATWTFQPNGYHSGNNRSLRLEWPFVTMNAWFTVDSYQNAVFSNWARMNLFDPGGTEWGMRSTMILGPANAECLSSGNPRGCCTGAGTGTCDDTYREFYGIGSDVDISNTSDTDVGYVSAFQVLAPSAVGNAGSTVQGFYGLRIDDLQFDRTGYINNNPTVLPNSAIIVRSQAVTDGREGNIAMMGGGYNTGHYVAGTTHVWQEAGGVLAVKDGYPTSAIDGSRIVVSARYPWAGPAAWAGNGITCTDACSFIGIKDCQKGICFSAAGTTCNGIGLEVDCSVSDQVRVCECY